MKFIRSIGTSETQYGTRKDGEGPNTLQRGHMVTRPRIAEQIKNSKSHEKAEDLLHLTKNNPDLVIRQYISVIDKLIRKPKTLKKMSPQWYWHREQLGQECWDIIKADVLSNASIEEQKRKKELEKYEAIWRWKLHPYAKSNKIQSDLQWLKEEHEKISQQNDEYNKNRKPGEAEKKRHIPTEDDIFGPSDARSLKNQLWCKKADGTPDYNATAKRIKSHLYEHRYKHEAGKRDTKGLITKRVETFETSTYQKQFTLASEQPFPFGDDIVASYRAQSKDDVAKTIYDALTEADENKDKAVHTRIAGKILHAHFVPLRVEKENGTEEDKALLDFHWAVKKFYREKIRKSTRGLHRKDATPLKHHLPADLMP